MQNTLQTEADTMTGSAQLPRSGEPHFLSWLVERGRLPGVLAERVARVQAETSDRLCAVILKLGLMSEEALVTQLCAHTGLPQLALNLLPSRPVELAGFNPQFAQAREIIPLKVNAVKIKLVTIHQR